MKATRPPQDFVIQKKSIISKGKKFCAKPLLKFINPTPTFPQPEYPQKNKLFISSRTI